jgi:hypothetical protein
VELVYTADLKSAGLGPCGFESRSRYQILYTMIRGSSMVERPTVNRVVVGSSPAPGAI